MEFGSLLWQETLVVDYVPLTVPDLRIDKDGLESLLDNIEPGHCQPLRLSSSVEFFRRKASARTHQARLRTKAGMCFSTPRHLYRPIVSTLAPYGRIS